MTILVDSLYILGPAFSIFHSSPTILISAEFVLSDSDKKFRQYFFPRPYYRLFHWLAILSHSISSDKK